MIDPQVAFDKLAQFETPNEIADYFRSENIKGDPVSAFSCPIAKYLQKTTGLRFGISCEDSRYTEWETREDGETYLSRDIDFDNTLAMADFVTNFDLWHYPDLVGY